MGDNWNPDISDDPEAGASPDFIGTINELARIRGLLGNGPGKILYVDGNSGSDLNTGRSWSSPLLTMAQAFVQVRSGDRILFRGNVEDQVSTPAGVFDVKIIGVGNKPRHADAHSGVGGYSAATWKPPASPTATTPLLKVRQQGWEIHNFLFDAHTDAPAVQLFRDGGAGDAERDGSHFRASAMRFEAGQQAIQDSGGCAFVEIKDCLFRGLTTAIAAVVGAGIGTLLCWDIKQNKFMDNTNHVVLGLSQGTILDNVFGKFTTMSIDLDGGAGSNVICKNALSGTYSVAGGYRKANANDEWAGNWNSLSGGITAADPA